MIKGAEYIIETLNKNGFQAYLVGGCVRDMLMDVTPEDYDITTDALPEDIIKLFKKTFLTGKKHGTVTVRVNSENFEVTTFRIDGKYINNRKPENVIFTNKLKEDIKRRDFTINSIACSPADGYIDYYDGINDIKNKIIRTVLNPYERFSEDALRILRGIRFSVKLGFEIEENTFKAMGELSYLIKNISAERVTCELDKMFSYNPYKSVSLLNELGILSLFGIQVTDEALESLKLLKCPCFSSTLAIILSSVPDYENILIKLKLSNKQKSDIKKTISAIHYDFKDKASLKMFLKDHNISDIFYNVNDVISAVSNNTRNIEDFFSAVIHNNECYSIDNLKVNGNDLIKLGIKNTDIGRILNELLLKVINNSELNTYEYLINEIRSLK